MDKIVSLAKARGFVYPGSEIYGGLANTWDYGNLGVELKNNVKRAWWKKFIQENPYNVGVDCAILMNPQTWVASGHLGGFSDPLMDCKECHERFRADKIIEDYAQEHNIDLGGSVDGWSQEQMMQFIEDNQVPCPTCGKHNFTEIRQFNLMFKTFQGVTEDAKNTVYLRPETAQGIFVNFKNVQRTSRKKIPFGIGQIGKSFRNEITPGNFTFRTREFEQMELEFFCEPDTDLEWFAYWKQFCIDWLQTLGIKPEEMRVRDHEKELQRISNFYSPLAGASCGASLTVPITTFPAMQRFPVRICLTLTIPRMKNISLMLLNRLWVQTVSFWHFYALLMTRKSWRAEMSVLSFISIRLWHRLKSASCRCPRSSTRAQRRSIPSCARSTTANLTTEAISVRDIAVRMKSVRRSALPTISNPRQTAA